MMWKVVILVFAVAGVLALGVYDMVFRLEDNACNMTYMWEEPEYLNVPLPDSIRKSFPSYHLFLYGEGIYAHSLRQNGLKVSGVPALFIPGNAGSHRQVRSLGSVMLRMFGNKPTPANHFNWFSVSFSEEMSGVYGGSLKGQTDFVQFCVKHILALYQRISSPPTSLLLVGHSMGGLVARALFAKPDFPAASVNAIITLATPQQAPVLPFDPFLVDFYQSVNKIWEDSHEVESSPLRSIPVISLAGGFRDSLIPSLLTPVTGLASEWCSLSKVVTAVPGVWASTDHQAIVWCRQLVITLSRAFFRLVDASSRQITQNSSQRFSVLHDALQQPPGLLGKPKQSGKAKLVSDMTWNLPQDQTTNKYLFSIKKDFHFIVLSNVDKGGRLYACHEVIDGKCNSANRLSLSEISYGAVLPPLYSAIQVVHLSLEKLKGVSHLELVVPPRSSTKQGKKVFASVQQLSGKASDIQLSLPQLPGISRTLMLPSSLIFYNFSLSDLNQLWQAYHVEFKAINCMTSSPTVFAVAQLWTAQYGQEYPVAGEFKTGKGHSHSLTISLRLQSYINPVDRPAELHLWSQPYCQWQVTAKFDFLQSCGQFVRHFAVLVFSYGLVVILLFLVFALQHPDLSVSGVVSLEARWLPVHLLFLTCMMLIDKYFRFSAFFSSSLHHGPFWLLPALHLCSFALFALGLAVDYLFSLIVASLCCANVWLSRRVFVVLLAIVCVLVAAISCGTVSIIILWLVSSLDHAILFHSTPSNPVLCSVRSLIMWIVLLSTPPLIFWSKQLSETHSFLPLQHDSSFPVAMAMTLTCSLLMLPGWQMQIRPSHRTIIRWFSTLLSLCVSLLWCLPFQNVWIAVCLLGVLGFLELRQFVSLIVFHQKLD